MEATMKDVDREKPLLNETIKKQAEEFFSTLSKAEKVTDDVLKKAFEGKENFVDYCLQFLPKNHCLRKELLVNDTTSKSVIGEDEYESQKAKLHFCLVCYGGLHEALKGTEHFSLIDGYALFNGSINNLAGIFCYNLVADLSQNTLAPGYLFCYLSQKIKKAEANPSLANPSLLFKSEQHGCCLPRHVLKECVLL